LLPPLFTLLSFAVDLRQYFRLFAAATRDARRTTRCTAKRSTNACRSKRNAAANANAFAEPPYLTAPHLRSFVDARHFCRLMNGDIATLMLMAFAEPPLSF